MSAEQWKQVAADAQRLSDIEAIKQLKALHIRLVDAKQWEAWNTEVLAEDYIFIDSGREEGREAVLARVSTSLVDAKTVHRIHPAEITITGPDTASALWPVQEYITMTSNGSPFILRGYAHHREDYVRTDKGWRIRRCEFVRQHADTKRG
jgi:hypothetical protein